MTTVETILRLAAEARQAIMHLTVHTRTGANALQALDQVRRLVQRPGGNLDPRELARAADVAGSSAEIAALAARRDTDSQRGARDAAYRAARALREAANAR